MKHEMIHMVSRECMPAGSTNLFVKKTTLFFKWKERYTAWRTRNS